MNCVNDMWTASRRGSKPANYISIHSVCEQYRIFAGRRIEPLSYHRKRCHLIVVANKLENIYSRFRAAQDGRPALD
jgi:hypothetical protein